MGAAAEIATIPNTVSLTPANVVMLYSLMGVTVQLAHLGKARSRKAAIESDYADDADALKVWVVGGENGADFKAKLFSPLGRCKKLQKNLKAVALYPLLRKKKMEALLTLDQFFTTYSWVI